jgi:integrase
MATDRGSVRYHRNGWELRIQVNGRRVTRRVAGLQTREGRRTAEAALEALIEELENGPKVTVGNVLDAYIAAEGHRWAPSTREKYPGLANGIRGTSLGGIPVDEVRQRHIKAAWGELRDRGRADGTVRRYHSLLSGALAYAVDVEMISANPALGMRLGGTPRTRVEELPALDQSIAAVRAFTNPRLRALALVALGTGARRGELAALRWSDVDLDAGTVRLTAAISAGERSSTKAGPGRTIGIDPTSVAAFKAWSPEAKRHTFALSGHRMKRTDPIWCADTDPTVPWVPNAMSRSWADARSGTVLESVRFHDLRHIHATALLRAGVPVHIVSHRLGHASPKMTLDVYSHVLPGDDALAVAVIAAATGSV